MCARDKASAKGVRRKSVIPYMHGILQEIGEAPGWRANHTRITHVKAEKDNVTTSPTSENGLARMSFLLQMSLKGKERSRISGGCQTTSSNWTSTFSRRHSRGLTNSKFTTMIVMIGVSHSPTRVCKPPTVVSSFFGIIKMCIFFTLRKNNLGAYIAR